MSQRCCDCGTPVLDVIHEVNEEIPPSLVVAISGAESLRRARRQLRLSTGGSIDSIISNENTYSHLGGNPFREDQSDVHLALRTVQPPPPPPPPRNPARDKRLPELSHRLRPGGHQQRPPNQGIPRRVAGESSKETVEMRYEDKKPVAPESSLKSPEKTTFGAENALSRRETVSIHPGYGKSPAARYRTVPSYSAARYSRQSYVEEDDPQATEDIFTITRTAAAQAQTGSSSVNNTYPEARTEEWRPPPHCQTPVGTPSKAGEKHDTPFQTPDDSPMSAEKYSYPMSSTVPLPADGIIRRDFAQFLPTTKAMTSEQPRTNGIPYRIVRVVQSEQVPPQSDESTARAASSTPDRVQSPTPDWVDTPASAPGPGATRLRIKRPEPERTPVEEKPPRKSFRKNLSKSLGKAKGKLADIFRDLAGEDLDVTKKKNLEVAMRDTRVYLNGFSRKSAFSRDYSLMREVDKVLRQQENARSRTLPAQRNHPAQAEPTASPGREDDDGDKCEKPGRRGIFGRWK